MKPPIGLVYDPVGRLVLDPDEQVQHAIRLLFDLFDHSSSAMAVVQHFAHQPPGVSQAILVRRPKASWSGALEYTRAVWVLHHPAYAGTYVYGRTKTAGRCLVEGTPRANRGPSQGPARRLADRDSRPPPRVHHRAQFQLNQSRLDENRTFPGQGPPRRPREGGPAPGDRPVRAVRAARCPFAISGRHSPGL